MSPDARERNGGVHPTWKWVAVTAVSVTILLIGGWAGSTHLTQVAQAAAIASQGEKLTRLEGRVDVVEKTSALQYAVLASKIEEVIANQKALQALMELHRRTGK